MEIKNTVEILTKDIQDIEKLVRNFNNYPSPPKIEIDLAMAKLRNIYDLLAMIASDITVDITREEDVEREILEENKKESTSSAATAPADVQEESFEPEPPKESEIQQPEKETTKEVENEEQVQIKEEPQAKTAEETIIESPVEPAPESNDKPTAPPSGELKKKASILAEKFAADKSINERIASKAGEVKNPKLSGEAIDSIRRNVGINDRFMIIRELLSGDNDAYIQFIEKLDQAQSLNEAMGQIEDRFKDNLDHNGVSILTNLAKRKFINQ